MCPPGLLTLFILSARSHGHAFAHSHAYKAEAYILNILWPVNKRAGQMHHPQQTDRFWGLGMFTLVLSPSEASTRFRTNLNREEQKKHQEPMFIRSHTGNDAASDRIDSHILFITWVIWVWIGPNEGLISADSHWKTLLSHKRKDLHCDFKLMQIQKRSYSQDVLSFGSRQVRIWYREDETRNIIMHRD